MYFKRFINCFNLNTRNLFLFGLVNFAIVALLGVIMRIKIGFEFPYFNQKNLLLSHAHFAFSGWVTHALYVYLLDYLDQQRIKKGNIIQNVVINYVLSFGLLVSFFMLGYHPISIALLFANLLNSYHFAWRYYILTKSRLFQHPSKKWFWTGLLFQILSSAGSIYLAWMMYSGYFHQSLYLGSTYFYLHFQYSGWFFFTVMGLFVNIVHHHTRYVENDWVYKLFAMAAVPAFLLSVLWANLPWYLFGLALIAVMFQTTALVLFFQNLKKYVFHVDHGWNNHVKLFFGLAFFAFSVKIILQTISVIPSISQLAFGYRSIVIAYLHLVLLGMISLFILGYAFQKNLLRTSVNSIWIVVLICVSVFANELVLMLQGIAGLLFIMIPFVSEILLAISILLFLSIFSLIIHEKSGEK